MEEEPYKRKLTKAEKKAKYRTDYAEPLKSRREVLKAIMNGPESERERKVRAKNREFFNEDYRSGVNIYGMAVDMMKAMPDRGKTSGQSLAVWYLEDFGVWLKESGQETELRQKYLTGTIQINALDVCTIGQKQLLSEIFDITKEKFTEDITQLLDAAIKKQDFSVAADMAIQYNLLRDHHFEHLVLPLMLSGKDQTAYKLISNNERMQQQLVEFFDRMVGISVVAVEEMLKPYKETKIMTIPMEKLTGKTLDKLISTIINKNTHEYNFSRELSKFAKNHSQNGNLKALKFNISERYEKGKSDDNYFQHMVETFTKAEDVREPILFYLWSSNDTEKQIDAICFAIYLGIASSSSYQLPNVMRDFFRQPDSKLREAKELLVRRKTLQVPLNGEQLFVFENERRTQIHMVKTESEMNYLCSEIKSLSDEPAPVYVGFDSEWKPSNLTAVHDSKIAIIQLFFKNCVWLVDCVELEKANMADDWWQKFASRLFGDSPVKVVGFDMRNDLDAMATIPALKSSMKIEDTKNAFDLKRLAENVCDIDMEILELPKKTFKLADLTHYLLGLELDKTEQCSNWQCRPLRKKQIVYAALDAVVVVETFKKILSIVEEKNKDADIEKIVRESNVMAPKKDKGHKSYRKLKTIPWLELYDILRSHRNPTRSPQRPHDIKVIVDTMLIGFGKNLRRVGIDVILPKDVSDFRKYLKEIERVGGEHLRHIITVPSKSYEALKMDYDNYTIAIPELNNMSPVDQLIEFFDLFNVDIRPEDVYPRCTECNSRLQIKFPGPVLHFLHQYCVIHVQNVYRADMSEFPLEEWWNRMLHINPDDYDGVKVEMSRPSPTSKWIVATVPTGCLHITRQTALHTNLPDGIEVRIHKVPDDEFKRRNLSFYVCGECGTVACDGRGNQASESTSQEC
ncbi:Exonuclease mut-7 [Caenorhabditis elegans]|uniref:Exonuclease mut-7 n=1 Tax=Caenorhabditis elegans TaxID=6239 RepID=MUT7_CAEEL|nr:Exonuclease mut-7 [Caenorhabditis elegans]P34607.1 RecName: Full=Exonuclease mut-7; AltName: Full=Exonuclease 3'-5' domain-containing protein 3 homolog [Caenorhabditis elegans]CAA80137.1 Exonuclease mut-7 [Caenorhabditis elegans]|eukprot:NP_499105.1 Exonuclease mut-7 [Caenorhabditis elegans]